MSKRPKDMTQEELDNLPEYDMVEYEIISLPDDRYPQYEGTELRIPRIRKMCVTSCSPDDLVCFATSDGRVWTPIFDGDTWYKRLGGF